MGYQSLIDKACIKAFKQLKDLAKEVTFIKKTGNEFSFLTASTTTETTKSITAKVVWLAAKKSDKNTNTTKRKIMLLQQEIGDAGLYDSILDDGVVWKLGVPIENNGTVLILEVVKEG